MKRWTSLLPYAQFCVTGSLKNVHTYILKDEVAETLSNVIKVNPVSSNAPGLWTLASNTSNSISSVSSACSFVLLIPEAKQTKIQGTKYMILTNHLTKRVKQFCHAGWCRLN